MLLNSKINYINKTHKLKNRKNLHFLKGEEDNSDLPDIGLAHQHPCS